jgi:hypothetical protein
VSAPIDVDASAFIDKLSAAAQISNAAQPQPLNQSTQRSAGPLPPAVLTAGAPATPQDAASAALPADFPILFDDLTVDSPHVTKIPLRVYPGDDPGFTEEDIVLEDGDIVFIESRETEFYFTGGLLGGGQYPLPRDYDLDVLGALAIAQAEGSANNNLGATRAVGGLSVLNQDVSVGASEVVVMRRLPNGRKLAIKVDLYEAMRSPCDTIYIQPGDFVVLQYTRSEAIGAFFERRILDGAVQGAANAVTFRR